MVFVLRTALPVFFCALSFLAEPAVLAAVSCAETSLSHFRDRIHFFESSVFLIEL